MDTNRIREIINGQLICGNTKNPHKFISAFASDLMSDVLALDSDINNIILVTGLINTQTIRTAEMADIKLIIICRNKEVSQEMKELALKNDISIIKCTYSMFKTSALLYNAGIQPIF